VTQEFGFVTKCDNVLGTSEMLHSLEKCSSEQQKPKSGGERGCVVFFVAVKMAPGVSDYEGERLQSLSRLCPTSFAPPCARSARVREPIVSGFGQVLGYTRFGSAVQSEFVNRIFWVAATVPRGTTNGTFRVKVA